MIGRKESAMNQKTIQYYNKNAREFIDRTVDWHVKWSFNS